MAEYIEREALLAKLDTRAVRYDSFGMGIIRGLEIAKEVVTRMPYRELAADVVKVVRCGECIKPIEDCPFKDHVMLKTDFCSYGERRDNDAVCRL